MTEKKYSSINLFIRSFLFFVFSTITIPLYAFTISLFMWALPMDKRNAIVRFYLSNYFRVLKFLCHIDYEIHGLENIQNNQTGIILSKHQSTWETFLLPLIFQNPAIIVKRELLWIPFFGWVLAFLEIISINRSQRSSAMKELINQGTKYLNKGRSILIFPEGTRSAYGTVGQYKLGGTRLAVATQYPIVPVAHNAGRFWPRRKFIKRPGTIKLVIGPFINPENNTPEQLLELTKNWIEETMIKIS